MAGLNGLNLPGFPNFNPDEDQCNVSQRWTKWLTKFEIMLKASAINDSVQKRALLLYYAGDRVYDIFETLNGTGEDENYDLAKEKLTDYFKPRRNTAMEIMKFRRSKQQAIETVDQYHTRLQTLAAYCGFSNKDQEIKQQIIESCVSSRLRRRALELTDEENTLTKVLDIARRMEDADRDANLMEKGEPTEPSSDICRVQGTHSRKQLSGYRNSRKKKHFQDKGRQQHIKDKKPSTCRNCGGKFPHTGGRTSCPAFGKLCYRCSTRGHFGAMCISNNSTYNKNSALSSKQNVRNVMDSKQGKESDDSGEDYTYGIHEEKKKKSAKDKPEVTVDISGISLKVLIDSGSTIDTIAEHHYERNLKLKHPDLEVYQNIATAYASSSPLPVLGTFDAEIVHGSNRTLSTFHVVENAKESLLSYDTAKELLLITISNSVTDESSEVHNIVEEYSDRFEGIGCYTDGEVHIHVDPLVMPVAQPHRRQPFHTRKKVDAELDRLLELDIIEPVSGPTQWVSPIVTPPKPKNPDEVRICVDMRMANKAIIRERHPTPTVDDMIYRLNGSMVFSKLDLNKGYHQLKLDEESRAITTFTTHRGLFRYRRLNFGISSAAEVFQHTISQVLQDIRNADNMSDDIIVYGSTRKEHDLALRETLQRLRDKNLTLNRNKCEFNKDHIEFYGYVLTKDGLSPDPNKVADIKSASAPKNETEVRSFLGMVNYCSRFIQDFSTISKPLRDLTKKDHPWKWGKKESSSFQKIKDSLVESATAAYFDTKKETELTVDASPVGLGAILAQYNSGNFETKVIVAYASRSLTDVEQRYSQTEKEALGLVWGCEHFRIYLLGALFTTIITDHKPLETIFNNPKSRPPARIERWALRLQPYNFTVKYRKGKDNPADYMSRHPANSFKMTKHQQVAEEYICSVTADAVPKALTIEDIKKNTLEDPTMQAVATSFENKYWFRTPPKGTDVEIYKALERIQNEISISLEKDIILRGTRIVIPPSLQERALKLAHQGHQGIVKTKQLLREKVWFPGIDKKAKVMVDGCLPCQATVDTSKPTPLQPTKLPKSPWTELSMDFCGPLPSQEYLMVIIDDYSRYPVVETVSSTSSRAVIPKIDKTFSCFGIPEILRTDNGPPFTSAEFRDFAENMGFRHRRVTPLYPQANGEAERFMQPLMKAIRCAAIENRSWKQAMYAFLRNYRATPHGTLGKSPGSIIFGRPLRMTLPIMSSSSSDEEISRKDFQGKQKMKKIHDRKAKEQNVKVGDRVLLKKERKRKIDPIYEVDPYNVIFVKGNLVTAGNKNHKVTRNVSHFKVIPSDLECTKLSRDEMSNGNSRPKRNILRPNYCE